MWITERINISLVKWNYSAFYVGLIQKWLNEEIIIHPVLGYGF
jgi:hypothetical protein